MKITSQNIPPELATLYASLISTTSTGAQAGTRATTRRGAMISPNKKQNRAVYNDITAAVEILIERLGNYKTPEEFRAKVRAEMGAINNGEWNPAYWIKCKVLTTNYLGNIPASVADNNPPPYAYRDPANMPTRTTYGAGSTDTAPARYTGQTLGGLFCDTLLVWCRTTYRLEEAIGQDKKNPAIISYGGTLTVEGDMRGSRPMLSLILRCYLTDEAGAALTTTANPADGVPPSAPPTARGCNSIYWRYILPATTAPFFNTIKLRKILRNLAAIASIETSGDMTRAVIMSAPRPMFGRGFNNNTAINSSLTGAPNIYQIRKITAWHALIAKQSTGSPAEGEFTTTMNGVSITTHCKLWHISEYPRLAIRQLSTLLALNFSITVIESLTDWRDLSSNFPWVSGRAITTSTEPVIIAPDLSYIEWSDFEYFEHNIYPYPQTMQTVKRWRKYKNGTVQLISTTNRLEKVPGALEANVARYLNIISTP